MRLNYAAHTFLVITCCFQLPILRGDEQAAVEFDRIQLSDNYYSEGIRFGDFNRDGKVDVVCGPYWYTGPAFKQRTAFYPPKEFPNDRGYSDSFFSFVDDFNGDGWDDVLTVGLPGTPAHWYENPQGKEGDWQKHLAFSAVGNESPSFQDLTGDDLAELICSFGSKLGYVTPNRSQPTRPWTFHPISPEGPWQKYTHGLGVGDVNGDTRQDILTATGWWEQPASLENDPQWTHHAYTFSNKRGGAQMFACDIDGDGDNDVITSLDAHGWGLSWFEQVKVDSGNIDFKPHVIMGDKVADNPFGVRFSQLHAMALADLDGDGLQDLVTGKCYWAHNGRDPGAREPSVVYWFRLVRQDGKAQFVPAQIDGNSGVGRQVSICDLNGDSVLDILTSNKKGLFAFHGKLK
jgi:hypothetical protein